MKKIDSLLVKRDERRTIEGVELVPRYSLYYAKRMGPSPSRRVVLVAHAGVSLLELAGPLEAFEIASTLSAGPGAGYEHSVVSARGGPVTTADGVMLLTRRLESLDGQRVDTLIVPGAFALEDVTRDPALVAWLRERASQCRRVCSIGIGAFSLAAAGLLDGRRVTTHWLHRRELAQRHPRVNVDASALFVRDGSIWTCAGVTTGVDLALALIEEDLGRPCAAQVARVLAVHLKRAAARSQQEGLLAARLEASSDGFAELERWIADNPAEDLSVEALARRVHMSPRNFARAYSAKRGRTPAKAVEAIRIESARRLLEETHERIEAIARHCGFGSDEQMRCAFIRGVGIAPREYRRRFTARQKRHEPRARSGEASSPRCT